jgi:hypothetical protein
LSAQEFALTVADSAELADAGSSEKVFLRMTFYAGIMVRVLWNWLSRTFLISLMALAASLFFVLRLVMIELCCALNDRHQATCQYPISAFQVRFLLHHPLRVATGEESQC